MNKTLAQQELSSFRLPNGCSKQDRLKGKRSIVNILSLMKKEYENNSKELDDILLDTIGLVANMQGYDVIATRALLEEEENTISSSNGKLSGIMIWNNDLYKTINELIMFVADPETLMTKTRKVFASNLGKTVDCEENYYMNLGSIILTNRSSEKVLKKF